MQRNRVIKKIGIFFLIATPWFCLSACHKMISVTPPPTGYHEVNASGFAGLQDNRSEAI